MVCLSQLVNLENIVERFHPSLFLSISSALETVRVKPGENPSALLPDKLKAKGILAFEPMLKLFSDLGLMASYVSLSKLLKVFRDERSTYGQQGELGQEIQGRLVDEMQGIFFLSLSPSEGRRYEDWASGWKAILGRFPDTTRDIEEMNKCFALGRYTASMFHALHVAEWGAIALGKYIGTTDPKEGWGSTERKLREIVKGGHSNLPPNLAVSFEFMEQMSREIDSMVLAWRHKVDHAANHLHIVPNTEFTPDIAEHIIGAVRIFMQRILEGIPESPSEERPT